MENETYTYSQYHLDILRGGRVPIYICKEGDKHSIALAKAIQLVKHGDIIAPVDSDITRFSKVENYKKINLTEHPLFFS